MRVSLFRIFVALSVAVVSGCGLTPLHKQIVFNDPEKADRLLKEDSSIVSLENREQTPLVLAAVMVREPIVRSILAAGADPNAVSTDSTTALSEAAYQGSAPIAGALLKRGAKADQPGFKGQKPLFLSVQNNFFRVTELLVKSGANVNLRDSDGNTPLHIAAMNRNSATVALLLEHGADPNLQNNEGKTALMLAGAAGFKKIAEDLLRKGANTSLQSLARKTAAEIAKENGFVELSGMLKPGTNNTAAESATRSALPKAVLGNVSYDRDGKPILVGSVRAREIRASEGYFLDRLWETGRFSGVSAAGDAENTGNAQSFDLVFHDSESTANAAYFAKLLWSASATVGAYKPSRGVDFNSKIVLVARSPNGAKQEYTSPASEPSTVFDDPQQEHSITPVQIKKPVMSAKPSRETVTNQTIDSLVAQWEKGASDTLHSMR